MKDWNEMTDDEREIVALSSIKDLAKMLDGADDVFKQIVIEEVFKFILGE